MMNANGLRHTSIIFIGIFMLTIIGCIALAMREYGWPFILGFGTASVVFQVGHKSKYGEWWVD